LYVTDYGNGYNLLYGDNTADFANDTDEEISPEDFIKKFSKKEEEWVPKQGEVVNASDEGSSWSGQDSKFVADLGEKFEYRYLVVPLWEDLYSHSSFFSYRYISKSKKAVQITHKQIADKFGVEDFEIV